MKIESMFYIALGTVVDLIEKADAWARFVELAEDKEGRNRCTRNALRCKVRYVVGFDREMDRLVKEYK
jgi:hypothetical protein